MTPNSEYQIIVSAPPGGLARQLSQLINYITNENATAPDWSTPMLPDFAVERNILLAQSVLDASQLLGIETAGQRVKCRFTSLPVATIREQFDNCKIVHIDCGRSDYLQMAWIYLVEDGFKIMGQFFLGAIDDYFTNFVRNAFNEPDLDFVELMRDPQCWSDPRLLLLLHLISRGHKRFPYEISNYHYETDEADSSTFLRLNFADICKPESGDTTPSMIKLIDFIGTEAVRKVDASNQSWSQLMKRLSRMEKIN